MTSDLANQMAELELRTAELAQQKSVLWRKIALSMNHEEVFYNQPALKNETAIVAPVVAPVVQAPTTTTTAPVASVMKRRGRIPGSKNKKTLEREAAQAAATPARVVEKAPEVVVEKPLVFTPPTITSQSEFVPDFLKTTGATSTFQIPVPAWLATPAAPAVPVADFQARAQAELQKIVAEAPKMPANLVAALERAQTEESEEEQFEDFEEEEVVVEVPATPVPVQAPAKFEWHPPVDNRESIFEQVQKNAKTPPSTAKYSAPQLTGSNWPPKAGGAVVNQIHRTPSYDQSIRALSFEEVLKMSKPTDGIIRKAQGF